MGASKGVCMKIKAFLFIAVIVAVCSNCQTAPKVYDQSVPLEESCILEIRSLLKVKEFDGAKVSSGVFGSKTQIPAGHHDFLLFYSDFDAYATYYGEIAFQYNFEAGKTYVMSPERNDASVTIIVREKP
jgi:hypothetical protein